MDSTSIPISPEDKKVAAWGTTEANGKFTPLWIPRGACGPDHVRFELLYCGVCHSDLHNVKNDLGRSKFPMVPGHELSGRVIEVGSNVTKVKVGDNIGVGCMVDSCFDC